MRINSRFGASTATAVLQAALGGLGIAYLPGVVTAADLETGRLVAVLPQHRRSGGGLYAVLPSRRQVPAAVTAFLEFASERIAARPSMPLRTRG